MPRTIALLAALLSAAACREEPPVSPPRPHEDATFRYPEELWDAAVEGETLLRLFVGPDGQVDTVRIERSSGYPAFDSAAVAGAHGVGFDPARRGTEAVGAWVLLPVQFEMPKQDSVQKGPK